MWFFLLLLLLGKHAPLTASNPYYDCATGKFFNPQNYLDQLPSLSLPFVPKLPYNLPPIKPSTVQTTKVFNIVTKYVYKSPVCIKISGKKTACQAKAPSMEHLVTKEYFVKDNRRVRSLAEDDANFYVEASEEFGPEPKRVLQTPLLSDNVKDLLIEDRLDQLETILPHYTRRRSYQTSTITVTKVRSNNRAMATLLVKNCIPQGYDLCPPKPKSRWSKVAQATNSTSEVTDRQFFG